MRGSSTRRGSGLPSWRSSTSWARRPRRSSTSTKLIELAGDQMAATFKADIVYVALHRPDDRTDRVPVPRRERQNASPQDSLPLGEGLTSRIIQSRQPLLLNQEAHFDEIANAGQSAQHARSYLGVPIIVGDEAIGAISVQSVTEAGRFGEADVRLLDDARREHRHGHPERAAVRRVTAPRDGDVGACRGGSRDLGDARPERPAAAHRRAQPTTCSTEPRARCSCPRPTASDFRATAAVGQHRRAGQGR